MKHRYGWSLALVAAMFPVFSWGALTVRNKLGFETGTNTSTDVVSVFKQFHSCVRLIDTLGRSKEPLYLCASEYLDPKITMKKQKQLSQLLLMDLSMSFPQECSKERAASAKDLNRSKYRMLCFEMNDGRQTRDSFIFFRKIASGKYVISDIQSKRM